MKQLIKAVSCLLITFCVGCVTPWNTQLPTPYAGDPKVESERMKQFDPFALDDIGPKTFTRPRDFSETRTPARRSKEAEYLRGMPTPGVSHAPLNPRSSYNPNQYNQAVPF